MGACVGLLTLVIHAGMWYHLSLFLDAGELGVAYTGITTATALSQAIGGPLAAGLLLLDGTFGLHGWQWLFICEGIPTIIFAVILKVGSRCVVYECMLCHHRISGTTLHLLLCMNQGVIFYRSGGAQAVTRSDHITSGHLVSGLLQ